jgi:type 1 glutamine amidotransferase
MRWHLAFDPHPLTGIFVALCIAVPSARADCQPQGDAFSVLLFSKTLGYRHESIEPGISAIRALGDAHGFRVEPTESSEQFDDATLARHQAVVFFNTSGDVLNAAQEAALQRFIRRGCGFAGIHSASDTEYDWPWYGRLVGAYFKSHPRIQEATLLVAGEEHPSTRPLPLRWTRRDEWYNFREDPARYANVILRIDEASYKGGTMSTHHPMAWYQHFEGGRAWYTALGHTVESYAEPLFLAHVLGGIRWAAGMPGE